jgi:hypothetical protein
VTTNLVPCNGIKTNFVPYLAKPNTDIEINNSNLIENNLTRIKVKTFNTYYSIEKIKSDIVNVIIDYFKENFKFGVLINLSDLYQKIMALGYIENIRTIIINENNEEDYYINGLSFLYFTPALIENKDHSLFTQMCQLEKFQYPELFINDSVLKSLIIVSNNFNISNNEI